VNEPAPAANLRSWQLVLRYALTDGVPRRSLSVALVVGSILNLINQGDRLVSGQSLDFLKLALTYCVPYFVSTYGAVSFRFYSERAAAQRLHGSMGSQHRRNRVGDAL
jgi:hypothetical protein